MASDRPADEVVERIVSPPEGDTDEALRSFLRSFNSKDLRTACRTLHIRVRSKSANLDNKAGYTSMLVLLARSRREQQPKQEDQGEQKLPDPRTLGPWISAPENQLDQLLSSTRRTIHCSFRLVNVLFSDRFYQRLAGMGARLTKYKHPEAEEAARRERFWQEVASEFVVSRDAYARLASSDTRFAEVDPGHIVAHSNDKLMNMWKELSTDYAAAYERSLEASSANTEEPSNDFFRYCAGKLETLYVSTWITIRPEAFLAVMNRVPKQTQVVTMDDESSGDEHDIIAAAPPKKRRRRASQVNTSVDGNVGDRQERERARLFSELEALTNALCAAKQAGMKIETTRRLEAKIEQYVDKVVKFTP